MGYSLSWLAIKGKARDAVLAELGFRPTGARMELPEAELCAAQLPKGWFLVVSDHTAKVVPDEALDRLSAPDSQIVTCFLEEHVMCSVAIGWQNGRRTWSVIHDVRHGHDHLQVDGEPPPEFPAIRDQFLAKQRDEDQLHPPGRRTLPRRKVAIEDMRCDHIFEIPIAVAQVLTGFRHDQDIPGAGPAPFEVLARTRPANVTTIPDLDPAHLAEARRAAHRRGLKFVAIGGGIFMVLLLAALWLSNSRALVLPLFASIISFVLAFVGAVEAITGCSYREAAAKWMTLPGWQRGVLGTLIVLGVIVLLGIVITAVVMLST